MNIYQLGDILPLRVRTLSPAGVPTEPDDVPAAFVYSDSALIETHLLPVREQAELTGYFQHSVPLDSKYSTGHHAVQYVYFLSGTAYGILEQVDVQEGGDDRGAGIAIEYFRQPSADYVLYLTDQGFLRRHQNPSVRR